MELSKYKQVSRLFGIVLHAINLLTSFSLRNAASTVSHLLKCKSVGRRITMCPHIPYVGPVCLPKTVAWSRVGRFLAHVPFLDPVRYVFIVSKLKILIMRALVQFIYKSVFPWFYIIEDI